MTHGRSHRAASTAWPHAPVRTGRRPAEPVPGRAKDFPTAVRAWALGSGWPPRPAPSRSGRSEAPERLSRLATGPPPSGRRGAAVRSTPSGRPRAIPCSPCPNHTNATPGRSGRPPRSGRRPSPELASLPGPEVRGSRSAGAACPLPGRPWGFHSALMPPPERREAPRKAVSASAPSRAARSGPGFGPTRRPKRSITRREPRLGVVFVVPRFTSLRRRPVSAAPWVSVVAAPCATDPPCRSCPCC